MTVKEFACAMYGCDVVKDHVLVLRNGEKVYGGRMEFLRYESEEHPDMWFTDEPIVRVTMEAEGNVKGVAYQPDYLTIIVIPGEDEDNA